MALLTRRNSDLGIIEGRFIKHVLEDQGKEIFSDINQLQKRFGFSNKRWRNASVSISSDSLTYDHISAERFVDIKTRNVKGLTKGSKKVPPGKKLKKIVFPDHNKPIWTHKKFIIKTLSFGFTEHILEEFKKLAKDEGLL